MELDREYGYALLIAGIIEILAGAALIAIYDNSLGYLGLIAGAVMLFTLLIIDIKRGLV